MHNYESTYGRFPPAAVRGKNGEPLLSWRVLLLPYLEAKDVFDQFHLDEPWDSPHNIELLRLMPDSYAVPYGKRHLVPLYHTVCKGFVGPGAAFEGTEGLRDGDFPDKTRTFLVIEAGVPVPWTKPEDLEYDPDGPLPDLRCIFSDMFRAVTADGSMWFIKKDTSESTLRAWITRNGDKTLIREPTWCP